MIIRSLFFARGIKTSWKIGEDNWKPKIQNLFLIKRFIENNER